MASFSFFGCVVGALLIWGTIFLGAPDSHDSQWQAAHLPFKYNPAIREQQGSTGDKILDGPPDFPAVHRTPLRSKDAGSPEMGTARRSTRYGNTNSDDIPNTAAST